MYTNVADYAVTSKAARRGFFSFISFFLFSYVLC